MTEEECVAYIKKYCPFVLTVECSPWSDLVEVTFVDGKQDWYPLYTESTKQAVAQWIIKGLEYRNLK